MRNITKLLAICAACVAMAGCQKSQEASEPGNAARGLKSIDIYGTGACKTKGNALWFPSIRVADSISEALRGLPREQLKEWEQQTGFRTMKSVYSDIFAQIAEAKTIDEYRQAVNEHARLLEITDTSIGMKYDPLYACIINSEGVFYAGDYLVKAGRDYRLMLREGDAETADMENYVAAQSYHTDDVYYWKYKKPKKLALPAETTSLKTGQYCGYGTYGQAHTKECIRDAALDKKVILSTSVDIEIVPQGDGCNETHYYVFKFQVEAQRKFFGSWNPYETTIWIEDSKFRMTYPQKNSTFEYCGTCGGSQKKCYDWDCITEDIFLGSCEDEGTNIITHKIYLEEVYNQGGVPNPLYTIPEPYLYLVRLKATHQGMDGIFAVINYGYSGTQGKYCE